MRTSKLAIIAAAALLVCLPPPLVASTFGDALAHFEKGDYEAARNGFEELVAEQKFAPELFFSLGNAHYRLGDIGAASLAYRRALFLDPDHRESAQNLEFLRGTTGLVEPDGDTGWAFAAKLEDRVLGMGLAAGIWVAVAAGALLILMRRMAGSVRVLLVGICVLGVSAAGASALLAKQKDASRPPQGRSIVLGDEAVSRSAPADGAPKIRELPAGSVVDVVATRGPWVLVELPEDLRAWLRTEQIQALWPYDPSFGG